MIHPVLALLVLVACTVSASHPTVQHEARAEVSGPVDATTAARLAAQHCSIPRAPPHLSVPQFQAQFKGLRPFIQTRPPGERSGQLYAMSALPAMRARFGDERVVLASSNSFSALKRETTLAEHLETSLLPQDLQAAANATWYLFGDTPPAPFAPLLAAYAPLPMDAAGDDPLVAWGIGGRGSGVSFHTHGAAMAETVRGIKRWYLSPPHLRPPFNPDQSQLTWALTREAHPPPASQAEQEADGILECTALEGDFVYVPPMWWHATLNLGEYNFFVSTFTQEHRHGSTVDRPVE